MFRTRGRRFIGNDRATVLSAAITMFKKYTRNIFEKHPVTMNDRIGQIERRIAGGVALDARGCLKSRIYAAEPLKIIGGCLKSPLQVFDPCFWVCSVVIFSEINHETHGKHGKNRQDGSETLLFRQPLRPKEKAKPGGLT